MSCRLIARVFYANIIFAVSASTSMAAPVPERSGNAKPFANLNANIRMEALDGIITDQTITAAGEDFYQRFSAFWHDKPLSDTFAIAIRERPSARRGNRIQIDYADRTVFETVLPPNRGSIPAISERAAEMTYESVVNANVRRLLFRDDEFAPDEF